ncbi:MAG: VOC family protein [Oscillospiraceae bacterium]|jgi:glyoxylase I family protein|nr:VOC family protein [Oscillospiraceae bacterium]
MNNRIPGAFLHHIALSVQDYDRSKHFYCHVLGMRCVNEWTFQGKQLCFLDIGDGSFLELHSGAKDAPPANRQYLHLCLHTSDLEQVYRSAVAQGATPNRPPFDFLIDSQPAPMPVKVAWLCGPDGEELELFQHVLRGPEGSSTQ